MKKLFKLTLVLIFAQLTQVQAQTSADHPVWGLNAALNPGLTFRNPRFVIGADLQIVRHINDLLGLTLNAGFTAITSKRQTLTYSFGPAYPPVTISYKTDQNLIPLQLGLKFWATEKVYLAGAAGIAIDINGNSATVWSATAGTRPGSRFDLGLKYENYANFSSSNQIALRLGYRIL